MLARSSILPGFSSSRVAARLITGKRWSGPLFFGLKGKPSKESMEA
jgi:hypothetical protein